MPGQLTQVKGVQPGAAAQLASGLGSGDHAIAADQLQQRLADRMRLQRNRAAWTRRLAARMGLQLRAAWLRRCAAWLRPWARLRTSTPLRHFAKYTLCKVVIEGARRMPVLPIRLFGDPVLTTPAMR